MQLKQAVKAVKEVPSYGHLTLKSKDFPKVKDLKIDDEIEVTVKLKVTSLRSVDPWEISDGAKLGDIRAGADIKNIKFVDSKEKSKS